PEQLALGPEDVPLEMPGPGDRAERTRVVREHPVALHGELLGERQPVAEVRAELVTEDDTVWPRAEQHAAERDAVGRPERDRLPAQRPGDAAVERRDARGGPKRALEEGPQRVAARVADRPHLHGVARAGDDDELPARSERRLLPRPRERRREVAVAREEQRRDWRQLLSGRRLGHRLRRPVEAGPDDPVPEGRGSR